MLTNCDKLKRRLFHASFHDFSAWGLNSKRVGDWRATIEKASFEFEGAESSFLNFECMNNALLQNVFSQSQLMMVDYYCFDNEFPKNENDMISIRWRSCEKEVIATFGHPAL